MHLHALATDGAFARTQAGSDSDDDAAVRWLAAPAATEHDLHRVLTSVHRRLGCVDDDDVVVVDPALAGCVQLSHGWLGRVAAPSAPRTLEVSAFGMSLPAACFIDGRDRKRLERKLRYMLRPPFAHDAVRALDFAAQHRRVVTPRTQGGLE
ncbi:MAG: hypothetical protein IPK74_09865 [Deltaproteobacteria bacterium]|nr:hypothetical protein [Deltaproteobacteria bacterium]